MPRALEKTSTEVALTTTKMAMPTTATARATLAITRILGLPGALKVTATQIGVPIRMEITGHTIRTRVFIKTMELVKFASMASAGKEPLPVIVDSLVTLSKEI